MSEGSRRHPGGERLLRHLRGALTIVLFTEAGRMRRLHLSTRVLAIAGLLLLILLLGATTSAFQLYRGQIDLARMAYLEGENRSLTALLQGQAEHLSRLKLELNRLKEFEQNLRIVSGIDSPAEPVVGTGHTPAGAAPATRGR